MTPSNVCTKETGKRGHCVKINTEPMPQLASLTAADILIHAFDGVAGNGVSVQLADKIYAVDFLPSSRPRMPSRHSQPPSPKKCGMRLFATKVCPFTHTADMEKRVQGIGPKTLE